MAKQPAANPQESKASAAPNGTEKKKRAPLPTDPLLLAVARLDRIISGMPEEMREWAIDWLVKKHKRKPACNAVPLEPR